MTLHQLWIFPALLTLLLCGCEHSRVALFRPSSEKSATAVTPAQVGIYRTHGPYSSFEEFGLITLRSSDGDLAWMYQQLREDAGARGAEAVIDLKITDETHPETKPVERCVDETSCNGSGVCEPHRNCWTDWETTNVTTYLATGTLIRRKK